MGLLLTGIGIIIFTQILMAMFLYATIRFEDWNKNE